MHPACFHLAVEQAKQQAQDGVASAAHAHATCMCLHAAERKCKGIVQKATMRQQGRFLTCMLPQDNGASVGDSASASATAADDDDDSDDEEDERGEVESGAALGLMGRRLRGMRTAGSYVSITKSKLKNMRTLENGEVVFDDQVSYSTHTCPRAA